MTELTKLALNSVQKMNLTRKFIQTEKRQTSVLVHAPKIPLTTMSEISKQENHMKMHEQFTLPRPSTHASPKFTHRRRAKKGLKFKLPVVKKQSQ